VPKIVVDYIRIALSWIALIKLEEIDLLFGVTT
jgi:hypothetical protein